jgi:hypothetical protein
MLRGFQARHSERETETRKQERLVRQRKGRGPLRRRKDPTKTARRKLALIFIDHFGSAPRREPRGAACTMVSSSQDQGSKKRKSLSGAADTASSPNKKANSAASPSSPSKKGKEKVVPGSALNSNDNAASSSKPRPRPRPSAGSAANGDAPSSSFSQEADGSSGKVEKRLSRGQKPSSGEVVIRSSAEQPIGPVLGELIITNTVPYEKS